MFGIDPVTRSSAQVQPYLEGAKLSNLMSVMQQHYSDAALLRSLAPAEVTSGQFCAVKNPQDGVWYRWARGVIGG